MEIFSKCRNAVLFSAVIGIAAGCQTAPSKPERIPAASPESAISFESTPFGKQLSIQKLKTYSANLHAHHFMGIRGSKKHPLSLEEAIAPGPCKAETGTFPMDDGRPCRDENGLENQTIPPRTSVDFGAGSPDITDYFRQACEYATHEGGLDIFFATPHTKNNGVNEPQLDASTSEPELMKRQAMLASMNPDRQTSPTYFCGLGQEASSISAGNHINIFGQFHADGAGEKPFFFPTGDFKTFYSELRSRNDAGARVFLQFNHPDVRRDLFSGSLAQLQSNSKKKKEALNDYGLDDFAPMGCLLGKLAMDAPECKDVASADSITMDHVRRTFANIRAASGDPFRLIEVVPPGAGKEGDADSHEDGSAGDTAFGATTNTKTSFRGVQHRADANTYEDGVHDWIFYLLMGFKLGPTADQDNHHMNWGNATASRTGVLATDLKEGTVLNALSSRHVFASEDRNTKVLLFLTSGKTRNIMGDAITVSAPTTTIQIGYYDPDSNDAAAKFRIYYYRADDPIDFRFPAQPKAAYHTVSFDAKNRITLPAPNAADRSERDLVSIRSGDLLSLKLPLVKGTQWVFVELVQDGDLDKAWTAPIWIRRP